MRMSYSLSPYQYGAINQGLGPTLTTWPTAPANQALTYYITGANAMSDTTEKKPKLSADEKLIVAALKGTKTPDQITTLIAISRLTNRTPAQVMEVMDDVAELVKDRVSTELPAPAL